MSYKVTSQPLSAGNKFTGFVIHTFVNKILILNDVKTKLMVMNNRIIITYYIELWSKE